MIRILRSTYDKILHLSAHPRATMWLMIVAFTESIFFPIPQDVMLLPMMLAKPKRAFYYATMCLIASVSGGVVGYFIGAYLFGLIADPILHFYGYTNAIQTLQSHYDEHIGFWAVLAGGFTPLPYKITTITSGALELSFGVFIIASIISRGLRFYLLAICAHLLGDKILHFVDRYFAWVSIGGFLVLIGGFLILKIVL